MEKLNVVIMGQNCEKFIGMCLESVKDADNIIYCDGGSTDGTRKKLKGFIPGRGEHIKDGWNRSKDHHKYIISHTYDQEDPKMNGKQRNFYLDYLKANHMNEWCLVLDADEVVEDINKIKEFINQIQPEADDMLFSLKMRHLIGDLTHEDNTLSEHFVPHRLFKIRDNLIYPELEHPVLNCGKETRTANIRVTTIWHMSHITEAFNLKKKYENHMKKSTMHPPAFLKKWYYDLLFGVYPRKQFNPIELPNVILENFGIDKDELYFTNRGLEAKHFVMAKEWREGFDDDDKVFHILELGCGRAPYGYAFEMMEAGTYNGIDISKFAIENSFVPNCVKQGNILDYKIKHPVKLVMAFDVLEHLEYKDLDKAIDNIIINSKKYILISVPYKESSDCDADPTHIIKESRPFWVEKFISKGLKEVEVPESFMWRDQLLIFEK